MFHFGTSRARRIVGARLLARVGALCPRLRLLSRVTRTEAIGVGCIEGENVVAKGVWVVVV